MVSARTDGFNLILYGSGSYGERRGPRRLEWAGRLQAVPA
jgi:hypothetical protein